MATVCPSFLRGTAMRVTKLDACGQPVYGPCSQVVSDGFVTVTLSAEVEDGEEITVTKANGKLCVSEKACDQLRWYTTEIEFCQVDPDLVGLMNPTWDLVKDANDDTIGYDAVGELNCDTGFALELWMDTYQATDACTGEGASGAWGYLLLPWVVGGAPGDLEIGNDAVSFTFNGRSKIGSRWRRGPYPVQRDAQGNPVPLLKPFNPKAHYRMFVSTVRPPDPECGCQPLDRPVPDPADLVISKVTSDTTGRTLRMRVDNHGFGPVTIDYCDGTTGEAQDGATVTHVFPSSQTGDCLIKVCDKQTPTVCKEQHVTVPMLDDAPIILLECDATDASGQTVKATITLPPQAQGPFTVNWGDGTTPQQLTPNSGTTWVGSHTYRTQSTFRVTATRDELPQFRGMAEIAVPCEPGPVLAITPGSNPQTDAVAQVTVEAGKTYTYQLDNGTVTAVAGSGTITMTGLTGGTHTIKVCQTGTTTCTTRMFTIPVDQTGGPTVAVSAGTNPATDAAFAVTPTTGPYTYRIDGGTEAAVPGSGLIASATYSTGNHTITVCNTATKKCTVKPFTIPVA